MIKPEDLLNAYDHLCLCAKQQIETIFTQNTKLSLQLHSVIIGLIS